MGVSASRPAWIAPAICLAILLGLAGQSACLAGDRELPPGLVGVPVPPEAEETLAHAQYQENWSHGWLYFSNSILLSPYRHEELFSLSPAQGVITGLASSPCGSSFIYALTNEAGSRLVRTYLEPMVSRQIAYLGDPDQDLCFCDPMCLSPNRRWLVATVSGPRDALIGEWSQIADEPEKGPQDHRAGVWLIDCAGQQPPRALLASTRLLSCTWAPSGQSAVCEVESDRGEDPRVLLLDPDTRAVKKLADGRGHAVWSLDGQQLRVYPCSGSSGEIVVHTVGTQDQEIRHAPNPVSQVPEEALWSSDGGVVAWREHRDSETVIQIRTASRMERTAPAEAGVKRLLGWSCGGELLAYVDAEGGLQLCSGTRFEAEFSRITATAPPRPKPTPGRPERPGGLALQTTYSPIKIDSPERLMAVWVRAGEARCLVYVDSEPGGAQSVSALTLKCLTLQDLGIDPRGDLRKQIIKGTCDGHLITIGMVIRLYAEDHEGRYPPHATGPQLIEDLEPYLAAGPQPSRCFGSAYAPNEIRMRLLHPGATREEVLAKAEEMAVDRLPLLELRGDDGYTFFYYTDGSVWMIAPDGEMEVVSEWD